MTNAPFTILIDGACHLCAREARLLTRLDAGRNRLLIRDISASDFDPSALNLSHEQVMGRMHGILCDGTVITGVEVFRSAYAAVGKGWLLSWTALPILRPITDRLYLLFARHRLRLSSLTSWIPGSRPLTPPCTDRCALASRLP